MIHPWKPSAFSAIKPCPYLRPLSPERTFIDEAICRLMNLNLQNLMNFNQGILGPMLGLPFLIIVIPIQHYTFTNNNL